MLYRFMRFVLKEPLLFKTKTSHKLNQSSCEARKEVFFKEYRLSKNNPTIQIITRSFNPVGLAKAGIQGDKISFLNLSENLEWFAKT